MNKARLCILLAAAGLMLSGCNNTDSSPKPESSPASNESSAAKDESSADEKQPDIQLPDTLPLISVKTQNQSANVLDFVDKPVAPHVASDIASWTPGYVMPPAPYYEACSVSVRDPEGKIMLENLEAEVKVRGNWTTTYDKKPLRIKFKEKQKLIPEEGGADAKNWVLLACFKDVSMLRDQTALELSRAILGADGYYAADTELVEVQINDSYRGVYLLTDMQQVHPDRVDIYDPKKDETGTDIGYFIEFDGYYKNEDPLQQFHVSYMDNAPLIPYDGKGGSGQKITCLPKSPFEKKKDIGFTIKSDIYSQEQHDFIEGFTDKVYQIMYHAAYDNKAYQFTPDYREIHETDALTPQQAVEAVVDVRSLADTYIISEITCDADIYWSSFYMSADFSAEGSKKLTFEAPWDFDSGLGNKDRCADGTGFYAGSIVPDVNGTEYMTVNPWLAVLMYADWYQDIIRDAWTKAYDSGVFSKAVQNIRDLTSKHSAAFQRNDARWGVCTDNEGIVWELCRAAQRCKTQADAAEYLAGWLTKRVDFLNGHWNKNSSAE